MRIFLVYNRQRDTYGGADNRKPLGVTYYKTLGEIKMSIPWQVMEKHYADIAKLGPEQGYHVAKDGFVRKFEGAKVFAFLKTLGHSSLSCTGCSCTKTIA